MPKSGRITILFYSICLSASLTGRWYSHESTNTHLPLRWVINGEENEKYSAIWVSRCLYNSKYTKTHKYIWRYLEKENMLAAIVCYWSTVRQKHYRRCNGFNYLFVNVSIPLYLFPQVHKLINYILHFLVNLVKCIYFNKGDNLTFTMCQS